MKRQILYHLDTESLAFPPISYALEEPNGLLALGGDLSPQRLVSAYQQGIFPWFSEGEEIMWWSPEPRAVIPIKDIHINRTLKKIINRKNFTVSVNKAFDEVLAYCADAPFRTENTWIIPSMQLAYQRLHQLGFAHSIEVWCDDELVGGLYGVAINGFFSGESMFYKCANASKIALVTLSTLLKEINGLLCPRIIELEVIIKSDTDKHLVRCTLFSEEEEILAFGESFLFKPGGKIYLTLRTRARIHGITLIVGARCSSDSY
jgi:leucyl/phenylalanyl-tRNA--protein transferase